MSETAIEVEGVSVLLRGNAILDNVTLCVQKGQTCAIIGPNGSGKSTLLAVLAGYIWPSSGTIRVAGQTFGQVNLAQIRRIIGLIEPSRAPDFGSRMTARDIVATGLFGTFMLPINVPLTDQQWQRVDDEIEQIGLTGRSMSAFRELSSGEQMKTLTARALVSNAKILLLDEPTVGLDIGSRAVCINVLDRLSERTDPPTTVVVSHHLDELPTHVSHIVLMDKGRVFAKGSPGEVLTSEKLSQLYNCDVRVIEDNGRFIASVNCSE